MSTLRSSLIRLAHARPDLRPHLLPVLQKTGTNTSIFVGALSRWVNTQPHLKNTFADIMVRGLTVEARKNPDQSPDSLFGWLQNNLVEGSILALLREGDAQGWAEKWIYEMVKSKRFQSNRGVNTVAFTIKKDLVTWSGDIYCDKLDAATTLALTGAKIKMVDMMDAMGFPTEGFEPGAIQRFDATWTVPVIDIVNSLVPVEQQLRTAEKALQTARMAVGHKG